MLTIKLCMLKGHGCTICHSERDQVHSVVDWSSAVGMQTTLCYLSRRTTITSQLNLNTVFALLGSEQRLRASSVSSLLKVQTMVLTKWHHQLLSKEGSVSCAHEF